MKAVFGNIFLVIWLTAIDIFALSGCTGSKAKKEAESVRLLRARKQQSQTKEYQVCNLSLSSIL